MANIFWKENGWNPLQAADAKRHKLEVDCFTQNNVVTEVRIRHNDGEEQIAHVTLDGKPALPMDVKTFREHFEKNELEFH